MKRLFAAVAIATCSTLFSAHAAEVAESYPNRTMTIVVPQPAGSVTDTIARKLAEYIRIKASTTVVVDNKTGADGIIAARSYLKESPDGHSFMLTTNSLHAANASIYRSLPFDPLSDFDMIGGIMQIPMIVTVNSEFPAHTFQEFLEEARKREQPLMYSTGNTASRGGAELLKLRFGIKMDPVFYQGAPQAVTDVVAGRVDVTVIDAFAVTSFIREGRLKGLAITSSERFTGLPDIPTVTESGQPLEYVGWIGAVVNSKTPPELQAKLAEFVGGFVAEPETAAYLASIGSMPLALGAGEFRTFIEKETKAWAELVEASGIERK